MRYAVVDTGSNTIRLGIYEYENKKLNIIYNKAVFANLAGYIKNNALAPDGIEKCAEAIKVHQATAKEYGCKLNVFATAAIRNAENTEEIVSEVFRMTGEKMEVLSGDDEAVLSFYGAVSDFPCENGIMADVGGGSSEIIPFTTKTPRNYFSVPWGSLKAYKNFVKGTLPTKEEFNLIKKEIRSNLEKNYTERKKITDLCIVGGGVDASVKLTKAFLGEDSLSTDGLLKISEIILNSPDFAKETILKSCPERLETIAPGIAIYLAVCEYFNAENIHISDKGIKEGYILKRLVQ